MQAPARSGAATRPNHRGAGPLLAALLATLPPGPAAAGELHVPSPDWRDQVVYFVLVDRFDDGDPDNNDQGAGEYDPADPSRYSGGDLAGLTRRIPYMEGLGATAVWITPPVAGQWLNPDASYGGYHGYWASDFTAVDPHYGNLETYQALSRALHGQGMYLVQDIVVNHVGDWIDCTPGSDGRVPDPAVDCRLRTDPQGRSGPRQPPFDRNDPRAAGAPVYHWTPEISDFSDRRQELDHALAGLDDLDTENPEVRRALRASYGYWIREAGVDAFRIDTAYHVPEDFFHDFLHADDARAPGIARVAADTGRAGFLAFGEGFGSDRAHDDTQARKLDGYMRAPGGLPSMLNFPLYGSLDGVFARGRPTAELAHRIESMVGLHADPHRMPSFIDNHDVDRFLAGGDVAGLKQALLALMTLPGIPVIYYGTEQGFTERRASMFAGGFGSGGRDHFDAGAPLYRYLQEAIGLRRGHRLFSRGTPTVLARNPAAAGAVAWRTDHGEPGVPRESALVVFNTATAPALLDGLQTGLPDGTTLQPLFGIHGAPEPRVVGPAGRLDLVLPPRSGWVWKAGGIVDAGAAGPAASAPRITPFGPVIDGPLHLGGTARPGQAFQLVVDGRLDRAIAVQAAADGTWQATVRTDAMVDPDARHRVVAFDPASGAAGDARTFQVRAHWQAAADQADPRGDDHGPSGTYTYPTGPGWRGAGPADIERVRAWTAGGALRVELTMRAITTTWNPANGFDHVALTAYLELPGRDGGAQVMPLQHARLPDGMRWHYRLRAHGWSNALFAAEGASDVEEGTPVAPGARIDVDPDARTVTFTLPADALGWVDTLAGARLHVTTWDYDGGYRALAPEAGPATFGGGVAGDPLVMDAVTVELHPMQR